MMKCPSCDGEMQPLDSGYTSHKNNSCSLGHRTWTEYELKIIGDAIAAARQEAFALAVTMAAQVVESCIRDDREGATLAIVRALRLPEGGEG